MRYTGPVKFIYRGNVSLAQQYEPVARVLIGVLVSNSSVSVGSVSRTLADGTKITVNSFGEGHPDPRGALTEEAQNNLSQYSAVIDVPDVASGFIRDVIQYQFAYCKDDDNQVTYGPSRVFGPIGEVFYVAGAWVCVVFIVREGQETEKLVFPLFSNREDIQPIEGVDLWPYVSVQLSFSDYLVQSLANMVIPRYEVGLENGTVYRFEEKVTQFMPWMPKGSIPYNALAYSGFVWGTQGYQDVGYFTGDIILRDGYEVPDTNAFGDIVGFTFNLRFMIPSLQNGGIETVFPKGTDVGYETAHLFYQTPESVDLSASALPFKLDRKDTAPDSDWYTSYSTVTVSPSDGFEEGEGVASGDRVFGVMVDASNNLYVWPVEARGSATPDPVYEQLAIKTNVASEFTKSVPLVLPDGFVKPIESFRDRAIVDNSTAFVFGKDIVRYGWQASGDGLKFTTVGWKKQEAPSPRSPDLGKTVSPELYQFRRADTKPASAGSTDPDAVETFFTIAEVLEFSLQITLTGDNLEDFEISITQPSVVDTPGDIFPVKAAYSSTGTLRYAGIRLRSPNGLPPQRSSADYSALLPAHLTDEFTYRIDSLVLSERGYVTDPPFALGAKPLFQATETPGFYHMDGPARRESVLSNLARNNGENWSLNKYRTWDEHRRVLRQVNPNQSTYPNEPFFNERIHRAYTHSPPAEYFEQAKRFTFEAELVFMQGSAELSKYTVRRVTDEEGKTRVFNAQATGIHPGSLSATLVCKESCSYYTPQNQEVWGPTRAYDRLATRVEDGVIVFIEPPRMISESRVTEVSTEIVHVHNGITIASDVLHGDSVRNNLDVELQGESLRTDYTNFACIGSNTFEQLFFFESGSPLSKPGEHFMNEVRRSGETFDKELLGNAADIETFAPDLFERYDTSTVELRPSRMHFNAYPWGLELYNYYVRRHFTEQQFTESLYSQADSSIYTCSGRVFDRTNSVSDVYTNEFSVLPELYSYQVDLISVGGSRFTHRGLFIEAFPNHEPQPVRRTDFEIVQQVRLGALLPHQSQPFYSFIPDPYESPLANDSDITETASFMFQAPTYDAAGRQIENEWGRHPVGVGNTAGPFLNSSGFEYYRVNPTPPGVAAAMFSFPYYYNVAGVITEGFEVVAVRETLAEFDKGGVRAVFNLDSNFSVQYSNYSSAHAPLFAIDAEGVPAQKVADFLKADYAGISYVYLR